MGGNPGGGQETLHLPSGSGSSLRPSRGAALDFLPRGARNGSDPFR